MMKSKSESIFKIYLCLALLFSYLSYPYKVYAENKDADTLQGLRLQLQELQNKKQEQQNKKKKTQDEINYLLKRKEEAEKQMLLAREQVNNLEEEIAKTGSVIETVKEESVDTLILSQKLQSDNIYISYITGASSMTELIMRNDMIDLINDYNNAQIRKLDTLTENNADLEKQLKKYNTTLEKNIATYESLTAELGDELIALDEDTITIDDEINAKKELIRYYTSIGCTETQLLSECVAIKNNAGWLKPVTKGVITSLFGWREAPTATVGNNHSGIDIGVSEGTSVYPAAAGVVGAIVKRSSCGGNKLYIWTNVKGVKYTYVYMHLKSISVNVGDKVETSDVVALSGGLSYGYDTCTTGAHLHFGISKGHHFGAAGDLALSKFNSYLINPPGFPGLGQRFYGR